MACVDAGIEERRVLVIGENARQISQLIRAVLADLEVPLNEDTTAIVDFLARGGDEYPFSGAPFEIIGVSSVQGRPFSNSLTVRAVLASLALDAEAVAAR